MDKVDNQLLKLLQKNGRASVTQLASDLGIQRATVRARVTRMERAGDIQGYTVQTRADLTEAPVRGLMMLEIAGRGTEMVSKALMSLPQVQAVHTTNGAWDLIADIHTDTLAQFDQVLTDIRKRAEISRSETNLLLSTRR